MKRKLIIAAILALAVIGVAWVVIHRRSTSGEFDPKKNVLSAEAKKILETGDRFVLLSLDPPWLGGGRPKPTDKEVFHNYAVLGKTEIRDQKERVELLQALYKGIADSDGTMTGCFEPRHGISATANGETVELVICFGCLSMAVYAREQDHLCTTRHALPTFNQSVQKAGLPVAKDDYVPPVQGGLPPGQNSVPPPTKEK